MIPVYELRRRILGIVLTVILLLAVFAICALLWNRHSTALSNIAQDRFSLSFVLALLICLYLLIIFVRAAHEPQYSMFLIGRVQEVIFLRQWGMLIAPIVVLVSLAVGYYKQPWQIPLSLVGWPAALYAIYGFVKDITGAWLRPINREKYFLLEFNHAEISDGVDSTNPVSDEYRRIEKPWKGRYLYVPVESDWDLQDGFLTSKRVNFSLQSEESSLLNRSLKIRSTQYKLPKSLNDYRETALIYTRSKGGLLHNENKIRLCSDLERMIRKGDDKSIEIQKTNYYFGVCSNEITRFEIIARDATNNKGKDLFSFFQFDNGVLIDLDRSELSNHIGGGTLAITPKGVLILSKQGRLNVVSAGLLVSSGAGSFDWSDQKNGADNLSSLIRNGLERELIEECGISQNDIEETIVLGMGRDISRGGKPEFFGVTLIANLGESVQPMIKVAEIGFVDFHDEIKLSFTKPESIKSELTEWLSNNRKRCSPTLIFNLILLINADSTVHKKIFSHVNG